MDVAVTSGVRRSPARAAMLVGVVGVAAMTISGCGAERGSAAAVVNGQAISNVDVRTATEQIAAASRSGTPMRVADILPMVIAAPTVHEVAAAAGKATSRSAASNALHGIRTPSSTTIQLVQANTELQALNTKQRDTLQAKLRTLTVSVNPRYGTFDPSSFRMTARTPDWIVRPPVK